MNLTFYEGDKHLIGIVVIQKRDAEGNPVGTPNKIPLLDTRINEVQMNDGNTYEYTANEIDVNLLSQVDEEGYSGKLIEGILSHSFNLKEYNVNQYLIVERLKAGNY